MGFVDFAGPEGCHFVDLFDRVVLWFGNSLVGKLEESCQLNVFLNHFFGKNILLFLNDQTKKTQKEQQKTYKRDQPGADFDYQSEVFVCSINLKLTFYYFYLELAFWCHLRKFHYRVCSTVIWYRSSIFVVLQGYFRLCPLCRLGILSTNKGESEHSGHSGHSRKYPVL